MANINIVIPMAGEGSRFIKAGYDAPKPFIDVGGKPMIERVLENLRIEGSRFILIARSSHLDQEKDSVERLKREYNATFLTVDRLTEGAACTILFAVRLINNDEPLLLANSDQLVDFAIKDFIDDAVKRNLDGSILTFYATHEKWSYAKTNKEGFVTEVREKKPISIHATVGIYYFKKGNEFVNSAVSMIARNDRVNNEFYTAPAYNYAIRGGARVGIYEIKGEHMHGLGTPEDLKEYLEKN